MGHDICHAEVPRSGKLPGVASAKVRGKARYERRYARHKPTAPKTRKAAPAAYSIGQKFALRQLRACWGGQ